MADVRLASPCPEAAPCVLDPSLDPLHLLLSCSNMLQVCKEACGMGHYILGGEGLVAQPGRRKALRIMALNRGTGQASLNN